MSRRRACCSISARRGFFAPASTSTSRTFCGSCSTDAATALMPTIHWFCLDMRWVPGGWVRERGQRSERRDCTIPRTRIPRSVFLLDAPGRFPARRQGPGATLLGQAEVDLALLQAGLEHDDADPVTEAEFTSRAIAGEGLAHRVEVVEVVGQLGDVDQAVDLGLVEFDEQAEASHAADGAVELAAHVLFHPRRAVAVAYLAFGLVGAALALGALQRQRRHLAGRIGERVALAARQRVLDRAVHQQVRVAPDRRGE